MLFPIDIAFLSETMVVTEVYRNVEPGYIVTSTLPARYFLEVNAGELEGIDSGDRATVVFLPLEGIPVMTADWTSTMVSFMAFMVIAIFMTAIVKGFVTDALQPPKEKPLIYGPRGERLLARTIRHDELAAEIMRGLKGKGEAYRAYVRYPPDKSAFVIVGSIIGGHYSWNPAGFTVWVSAWKERPEQPRDSIIRISELRPPRSYPATEEEVKRALDYVQKEFPTFTESTWVSNSIPVYVAHELGILKLEHLPQTTEAMKTIDARGMTLSEVYDIHRQYPPNLFRGRGVQYSHLTTEKDIEEFKKRAVEAGAVVVIIQEYGQTAYVPITRQPAARPDIWETRAVVLEDTLTGMPGFQDRLSHLEDWLTNVEQEVFPKRELVRRTIERFPDRFGITKDNVVFVQFAHFPATIRGKPARDEVEIGTWVERDRIGIWLTDKGTGKTVAQWWDEDAREMFEQGWFKPGDIRRQTITGRAFEESVLDYAESMGLLAGDGLSELLPGVRVMPKLPPEAYKDIMFCEYIRDLVRLGETITDEEARRMWEARKKQQPQRLPAVAPREGQYSWLITDRETGEIMIKTGYATIGKAQRAARDFALRRARYAGEHPVKLRIYDRDPDIGKLEIGVVFLGKIRLPEGRVVEEHLEPQAVPRFSPGEIVMYKGERVRVAEQIGDRVNIFIPSRQELVWVKPEALEKIEGKQPAVIPTEPRRPRPGKDELEFLPDSPEFLAYTIDDIGYRERIDTAFQQAIKRAKGLK
jgi:hypothetical protein